jgi:hypothetical protein
MVGPIAMSKSPSKIRGFVSNVFSSTSSLGGNVDGNFDTNKCETLKFVSTLNKGSPLS